MNTAAHLASLREGGVGSPMSGLRKRAKRGERCRVHLGDGSSVTGTVAGYRKRNAGHWNAARYTIIMLDSGDEFETILPAYREE